VAPHINPRSIISVAHSTLLELMSNTNGVDAAATAPTGVPKSPLAIEPPR